MNDLHTLFIVLATLLFAALVLAFVLPYLKRQGVDVGNILDSAKDALFTVNKTLDTIRPFLPATPGLALFDKILAAASVGVGNAEQLYHVGKLEAGERKKEAHEYIITTLKLVGIEITPEVEKLIDGAIEAEVLNLGHKSDLFTFSEPLVCESSLNAQAETE